MLLKYVLYDQNSHIASMPKKTSLPVDHDRLDKVALEVEQAVGAQDLQRAIACFDLYSVLTDAKWSELVKRMVALAVRLRDGGDVEGSLDSLLRLWAVAKRREVCVEILVVFIQFKHDTRCALLFISTIPPELWPDSSIRLLAGRVRETSGDMFGALQAFAGLSQSDFQTVPSFRRIFCEMAVSLTAAIADSPGQLTKLFRSRASDTKLSADIYRLMWELPPNHFNAMLRKALSFGSKSADMPIYLSFCNSFPELAGEQYAENGACALRFLVSLREANSAIRLAELLSQTSATSNPDFVKSLFKLSDLTADNRWKNQAEQLSLRLSGRTGSAFVKKWASGHAVLQWHELTARHLRRVDAPVDDFIAAGTLSPTPSRPRVSETSHLFVGLFGQLRFPEFALPRLRSYLDQDLDQFKIAGGKVSAAVATWSVTGQRKIEIFRPASWILARLPVEVVRFFGPMNLALVQDVATFLPSTVAKIIALTGHADATVDDRFIEKYFGECNLVSIACDDDFMAGPGEVVSKSCAGEQDRLNQARMWNRISAFGRLIAEAEAAQSAAVTHALLMRNDLLIHQGSISSLLNEVGSAQSNWAFVDHDPYAEVLEGAGDRFILVDRVALDRLLDVERLMQVVAKKPDWIYHRYIERFFAHRMLDSALFEHGTSVFRIPQERVGFSIYRHRYTVDDLRTELAADVAQNTEGLKDQLARILT